MAVAIALCSTDFCTGITVFEDAPTCFKPVEMPCEKCNESVTYFENVAFDLFSDR